MVKNHSDTERGIPLPPHGLLFPINSKGSFICTIPHIYVHLKGYSLFTLTGILLTNSSRETVGQPITGASAHDRRVLI